MIHKSYLIEENIDLLKNKIVLFYGENIGLIDEFKRMLLEKNQNIIKFTQEEILKSKNIIFNEVQNISLFESEKFIFISNVNDKIFNIVEELQINSNENYIYLFADILDKKSKLRKLFESNKNIDVIPCYNDNEISIRKIIIQKLKGYSGVTPQVISTLINNSNLSRIKINNEINKIKTFFINKSISHDLLDQLLNLKNNSDFEKLRDNILSGKRNETNNLLSTTIIEAEKIPLYLNIINQRLKRLKDVLLLIKKDSLTSAISKLRPPIFWKDKDNFTHQANLWNKKNLDVALKKTYDTELKIKSKTDLNKNIILKKLLLDICVLANS
tara:strand:+ start:334 stop:1317 length:984 start_codon:yes stop_codon:yes gene_type:complete